MTETFTWRRPVIKVGTSTLTAGTRALSLAKLADVVEQVTVLHRAGLQPILVSSGAVAVGRQRLSSEPDPRDLTHKQVMAAVGQSRLMHLYDQAFEFHGITCAQLLLTREDLAARPRYLNARSTLMGLCAREVVPIINENDVVANDEIKVGDNDTLSALVANLAEADVLILVSDIPGLYTANPTGNPHARLVRDVQVITAEIETYAGGVSSGLGTGGMATKIAAAKLATASGTEVRIVDGRERDILLRVMRGEEVGTRFAARADRIEGRKRWILSGPARSGALDVDQGALEALMGRGASLLPAGITAVYGAFDRGDTVEICAPDGAKVAAGLVNYGADDVRAIAGHQSGEIESMLGYSYGDFVVHRDNMAPLLSREPTHA